MYDLKLFRKENNLKQEEAAKYFGCTQAFISQIELGNRPIPDNFISKAKADPNLKWHFPEPKSEIILSKISIPLLPISAQGGSLNQFFISVKDSECEHIISPIKGADFAITVSGESMAPEYPNGSQILIKKINEKAFIEWGRVYVLDTCNGTVIKTIVPGTDGCLRCESINPDPKFAPFEICMKDIYAVYRVLMCMAVK